MTPTLTADGWPINPGILYKDGKTTRITRKQEDIDDALAKLELEKAKYNIHVCYGVWSVEAQEQLLRVIKKITDLNEKGLSEEHRQLNYTLDAASSLANHMFIVATNEEYEKNKSMLCAKNALILVSKAYEKKNDYCKAFDTLSRLHADDAKYPQESVLKNWQSFISSNCPKENIERQKQLYDFRQVGFKRTSY